MQLLTIRPDAKMEAKECCPLMFTLMKQTNQG